MRASAQSLNKYHPVSPFIFRSFPWVSSFPKNEVKKTACTLGIRGEKQADGQMSDGWTEEGMVDSSFLPSLEWSESSLKFGNVHDRVVSMSPRLTFLMQDWGIQRSAPLKFLVGVRREAARLLKTVCDIDIKTEHIEWCQLKFHSVPFGKLGSWVCQCEMNNETSLALFIFYLKWNSPLLLPEAALEPSCTGAESKRKESSSHFICVWNWAWRLNDYDSSVFRDWQITAGFHYFLSSHGKCVSSGKNKDTSGYH